MSRPFTAEVVPILTGPTLAARAGAATAMAGAMAMAEAGATATAGAATVVGTNERRTRQTMRQPTLRHAVPGSQRDGDRENSA